MKKTIRCMMIMAVLLVFGAGSALAAGTASGTNITNQASISFSVSGVSQTPIDSNTTTFVVDNRVDLSVVLQDATYVDVAPAATLRVLRFRVQNDGNTTQDFQVSAANLTNGLADPFGGTDSADIAGTGSFAVYVDTDNDDAFTSATDTDLYIDELAADANIEVFVVATIPNDTEVSNGDIAGMILTATALAGGSVGVQGGALTETAGADDPAVVDIVFGDAASDGGDTARNASFADTGAYRIATADISIAKTSTVIRDPFNLNTNPKHIPGAYVQYTITITNDALAGASATLNTITDALDANTAIDPDLIVAATGAAEDAAGNGFKVVDGTGRAAAGTTYYTTANDADGVEHNAGTVTATMTTVLAVDAVNGYVAGELKPGDSVTLTFNVIIQ